MPPVNTSIHVGKHSGWPEEDAVMAAGQKCYQHRYSNQAMID